MTRASGASLAKERDEASPDRTLGRVRVEVRGVVQGVGFRPFVYRVAHAAGVLGWVRNEAGGVVIEAQGERVQLARFLADIENNAPSGACIDELRVEELASSATDDGFRIVASEGGGAVRPSLPADLAPCADCAAELASPADRRYRYPFTNCTHCGPRFTIVLALPYDRAGTTLRHFPMCDACRREYEDPLDRRFHAEPTACPACGPTLRLEDPSGARLADGDAALRLAARALDDGRVIALKGVGGFQLLASATNGAAVRLLRARKHRAEKPFAVMVRSLQSAHDLATLSDAEERALTSKEAPIVLLRRTGSAAVAAEVAPNNPYLGLMLPSSPLHRLLLDAVDTPLVCTSGNLSEEPIATDDDEAHARLGTIADLFLMHDRPIARPVDDSVVRVDGARVTLLRRARGFAPRTISRHADGPTVLALGAHLKATIALGIGREVVLSQHLGDLDSAEGRALLGRTVDDFLRFFAVRPAVIACDLHPDYASTLLAQDLARTLDVPVVAVQHHHAHVAACALEHALEGEFLGFAWDGTGYGTDGTSWGGEALRVGGASFERVAHLEPFLLPGGDRVAREPRRAALGLLAATHAEWASEAVARHFAANELRVLEQMLERRANVQTTTSVGRLFDAVAALVGLRGTTTFEGQAAMELEWASLGLDADEPYPLPLVTSSPLVARLGPLAKRVLGDVREGLPTGLISARFHEALAVHAVDVAERVGLPRVVLSGGCFQNVRLAARVRARLVERGFTVYLPARVPPNDGGIALGQVHVVTERWKERPACV